MGPFLTRRFLTDSKNGPALPGISIPTILGPPNQAKVLIGLPGFWTRTAAHDPEIENVAYGTPGVLAALSHLHSTDNTSFGYFQGTAMFSHDGGAEESLYARHGEGWWWWLKHWLGN
jgi:hypothetical protein